MEDTKRHEQTHFERVPLEIVKTIMRKGSTVIVREGPLAKTEPYSVPPTRLTPRGR